MILKKAYQQILLPGIIVLSTAIAVAQVTTGGKWMRTWFAKGTVATEVTNEQGNRKKTMDDPWVELDRIYKVFNVPSVYYSGKIRLMDDDETSTIEDADFSCEIRGKDYKYTIDSVELIYKKGLALNVYHDEKLIVAGNEQVSSKIFRVYSNIDSLRKFASQQGAVAEVMQEKNYKIIKIENTGNTDVYGYEIFYDPADYTVKKVVLSLATLDDYDEDSASGESKEDNLNAAASNPPDVADTSAVSPSIEFNLYKMEISYEQFHAIDEAESFNPVEKFGRVDKSGLVLNEAYGDYKVVWMNEAEKTKKK
jgi:hypothetical protein